RRDRASRADRGDRRGPRGRDCEVRRAGRADARGRARAARAGRGAAAAAGGHPPGEDDDLAARAGADYDVSFARRSAAACRCADNPAPCAADNPEQTAGAAGCSPTDPRVSMPNSRAQLVPMVVEQTNRGERGNSRSEEHTSELQSRENLVCRLLLEKKKTNKVVYKYLISISQLYSYLSNL